MHEGMAYYTRCSLCYLVSKMEKRKQEVFIRDEAGDIKRTESWRRS